MGLDIYVGSLTRYYSGDWETVVQRWGREHGFPVQVIRPQGDPADAVRDPRQIGPVVVAWRKQVADALGDHLEAPMVWNESHEAPYFTDKPGWGSYGDLLLWAAYEEHPELERPEQHVADFRKDPAYLASNQEGHPTRYPHLLCSGLELWLPCHFTCVFRALTLSGQDATIGSSLELLRELQELNERTWNAGPEEIETWRRPGPVPGEAPVNDQTTLEQNARYAYAMLLGLAELAVRHRVPLKLDY